MPENETGRETRELIRPQSTTSRPEEQKSGASAQKETLSIRVTFQDPSSTCEKCRDLDLKSRLNNMSWEVSDKVPVLPSFSLGDCKQCAVIRSLLATFGAQAEYWWQPQKELSHWSTVRFRGKEVKYFKLTVSDERFHLTPVSISFPETTDSSSIISFGRYINKNRVDFELINSWIDHCCENHSKTCDASLEDRIPRLKAINCSSQIVEIIDPQHPYAALSYTWGATHAAQEHSSEDTLSSIFPKTVLDAMLVALKLGISYLWVSVMRVADLKIWTSLQLSFNLPSRIYGSS